MPLSSHILLNSTLYLLQAGHCTLGVYETQEKATQAAQTALQKGLAGWPTHSPCYTITPTKLNGPPERLVSTLSLQTQTNPLTGQKTLTDPQ
jgi:hypothetical protein